MDKVTVIAVIAVLVLGPQRLPGYAAQFARFIRALRDMADGARGRLKDELGPEFDDLDWKKLDPRQYDPRHIIRQALWDDEESAPSDAAAPDTAASDPPHALTAEFEPLPWVDKSIDRPRK